MPKKIDPEVRARAIRLINDHASEYPSLTAAAEAVAKQVGVGKETVRRWALQAQIDAGQRQGVSSEELAEIKELKAKVRRLESDNAILKAATVFFAGELDPGVSEELCKGVISNLDRMDGSTERTRCERDDRDCRGGTTSQGC